MSEETRDNDLSSPSNWANDHMGRVVWVGGTKEPWKLIPPAPPPVEALQGPTSPALAKFRISVSNLLMNEYRVTRRSAEEFADCVMALLEKSYPEPEEKP